MFDRLRPRSQILDDIPIKKVDKGEKYYMGESYEVGFYKAAFIARLRLPLSHLYSRLVDYFGIFVC